MKLISMTDFVLENSKQPYVEGTKYIDLVNYAKLLKKPLKLEMFVPCDEYGKVLEEPEDYELRLPNMMTEYNDEVYRYKQAKSKVLFEGFKINGNYIYYGHFMVCLISEIELYTVESLLNHFIPETEEVQLTESAIKQIE